MKWLDHNGKKLSALSQPGEIIEELNRGAVAQGIISNRYYFHSEQSGKAVISNVPSDIYKKLKPRKYFTPENVSSHILSLVLNLKENINIFHNNDPDAATGFADGKVFQLNQCHHNSTGMFFLIEHLASIKVIKINQPVQIVLGYFARKIPFGTQTGNTVIENNLIWVHDWHIWNYVEKVLVDMSVFKNGNLLPPDGNITSWGTSEDHVFVFPPKGMEYWGVTFENLDQFNKVVKQVIGFKQ
jgi:hypothetical protein